MDNLKTSYLLFVGINKGLIIIKDVKEIEQENTHFPHLEIDFFNQCHFTTVSIQDALVKVDVSFLLSA